MVKQLMELQNGIKARAVCTVLVSHEFMTLVQHPATEILSAILPSDPCRIICEFAAPHAAPTITTVYQLIRTEQKEELAIFAARWQVPCNSVQHIVEFSPNGRDEFYPNGIDLVRRQIRVSSSWARERERYGLGRKSRCLCARTGGAAARAAPCVWLLGEDCLCQPSAFSKKPVELGKGGRCPYTYGPVSLRHLRSDATFRSAEGTVTGFEHFCQLDGWALFSIRRYRKWVWSTYDADRFTANVFI
jgi:hypothetical protein